MPEVLKITTPENCIVNIRLAGISSRAAAFICDIIIQFCLLFVLFIVLIFFDGPMRGVMAGLLELFFLFGLFFFTWGYYAYYEYYNNGQTPGKQYCGIRTVTTNGQSISFFSAVLRNMLRFADFLPFSFLTAVISMLITNKHQRIGDIFADTIVIKE